ncbi:complement C1q and tumor necrosis factor-related protein 9A-like [Ostrea edulis]|uniref:complement C1q and tumor necrosis factor-related protein 9A-like n=1 Tax=Ostrea edulis TaxID=37623 RepID=UPI0024AFBA77|nr:complement C1q and tumor necrosis factor-related protein 9A-like [Ostrea edulis]
MKSELADTQQNQLKMAAAVLSLEWFKNNMSKGNCDISKRVGFTAGVSSSNTRWSSGKLVFNKVLHNKGAGYDSSSGVFTAPSAGVYVFYVSITSYSDNEINVDITLNGYSQVTARDKGGSGRINYSYSYSYQTGTNMATLSLKRRDRVWVQYTAGTGYSSKSVPTTTFSGFLI